MFKSISRWDSPEYSANLEQTYRMQEAAKLQIQTASSVTSQSSRWVYPNWLAEGELTVLAGTPGTGKTALSCLLAAGITKGKGHQLGPGLSPNGAGHVIFFNTEDDHATTLRPRLEAAGANMDMVQLIDCRKGYQDETPFSFSKPRDLQRLLGLSEQLKNGIGLIIIDPIYFAVDGDHNNAYKVRAAYESLAKLAKNLSCAILGIAHAVKNPLGKEPLTRVAGPPALREVPRSIMLLSKISSGPTEAGGTHVLVHAKNNIGSMDGGFEYRVNVVDIAGESDQKQALKIEITREIFGPAEDLLKHADRSKPVEKINKTDMAVQFLQKTLKDGPQLRITIEDLANKVGITRGTLLLAKEKLKLSTEKRSGDGRSLWRLPDSEVNGKDINMEILGDVS